MVEGRQDAHAHVRPNVKWSDGKPLTAADVVYSLRPAGRTRRWTAIGLTGAGSNIASVKAKGQYKVVIRLQEPDSQFIGVDSSTGTFVVPQHIWSKVADVATSRTRTPSARARSTAITRFSGQSYV